MVATRGERPRALPRQVARLGYSQDQPLQGKRAGMVVRPRGRRGPPHQAEVKREPTMYDTTTRRIR